MTATTVDIFCRSFPAPPTAMSFDIDDTCDAVHGQWQLSLFSPMTPPARSCARCHDRAVRALLAADAKCGMRDEDGRTPFDLLPLALKGSDLYWRLNEARFE